MAQPLLPAAPLPATALAGETLDALCWRVLGRTDGVVEEAIALNPAHAASVILPEGAAILLPSSITAAPAIETVQLWN